MDDDNIYLDYAELKGGSIICRWSKNVEDVENVSVYFSQNDTDWYIDKEKNTVMFQTMVLPFPQQLLSQTPIIISSWNMTGLSRKHYI